MSNRTPLILILLKVPVTILLYTFQYSGTLLFAPTYLYFLLIKVLLTIITLMNLNFILLFQQPFVFSQKFETSSSFYAALFIPRALLVAGGFGFAITQMYYLYRFVVEQTEQEGQLLSFITLFSTIFCLSFLFRRGYKQLFEVWRCPQLKSVMEHLEILGYFLRDLVSIILTIIVFLLVVRIRTVLKYKSGKANNYLFFIWKMTYYSLFEDIGLLGYLFLHVFRWRLALTKDQMRQASYKIKELLIVYEQVFHTLIEILFSPLLLIIMSSKFSRRQVLLQIEVYPIEMIKRIVFDNFIEFLSNELRFVIFALGCIVLPYKIKLIPAITANYNALLEKIQYRILIESKKHDLDDYLAFNDYYSDQFKYIPKQLMNEAIVTHFLDIIAFICIIPQAITVFYLKRLNKQLKEKKLFYNYVNQAINTINAATYRLTQKGDIQSIASISYGLQTTIIVGLGKMLFDVPFYIMGLMSIILAPWRITDYKSEEYKKKEYFDRRILASKTLLNAFIDWIAVLLFIPSAVLTGLFRGPYIKKTIKAIFQKDFKNSIIPDSKESQYNNPFIFNNLQIFMLHYFSVAIFDILYFPIFLIVFLPVYTIWIYKKVLIINRTKDYEFTASRRAIFSVLEKLILDLFSAILLSIIYLTYYQRGNYNKYLEFNKVEYLNQVSQKNESAAEKVEGSNKNKDKPKDSQSQNEQRIQFENELNLQSRRIEIQFTIVYFIFLDCVSLIPRFFILITFIKQRKYHRILSEKYESIHKEEKLNITQKIVKYEQFKFKLKFLIAVKLVLQIIVAILCLAFTIVSTWRIPFLYMMYSSKEYRKQIIGKETIKTPIHFAMIYGVGFVAYILDIIYFPLLLLSFVMSPLVVFNYIKNISYRYSSSPTSESLYNQIYTHKRIIFHYVFTSALKDFSMTFKLLLVIVTGIRVPFLIEMMKKNLLTFRSIIDEYYALVKPKSYRVGLKAVTNARQSSINKRINKLATKLKEEQNQNENQNQSENTNENQKPAEIVDGLTKFLQEREFIYKKLTFRRILSISFIEMLKDFPLAVFSLLVMILFPWRIFSILRLWKQTLTRLPLLEDELGKVKLFGVRVDLFKLFGEIFTYDLPCIVMNSILIISLYKIPKAVHLLIRLLQKTFRQKDTDAFDILANYDYRRELKKQVKILWQEVQTQTQYVTIYILMIRVQSLKRRLKRFDHKKETKEKLRLYSLMHPVPLEERPTRACMQTLSYNVYSKIAEFLDIKDLGSMLLTNRKMHIFTKQELIWEHLFNYKYSKFTIHYYSDTYKFKCIEGYKHELSLQIGKPISEEIRDEIIGRNHIIFDEYLATIFDYPGFMINKFSKTLCKIFNKTPQTNEEYQQIKNRYNRPYYIQDLSVGVNHITLQMIQFQNQQNNQVSNEVTVEVIVKFIYFFINKFESYVYLITRPSYEVFRLLSAGDTRMYQVMNTSRENVIDYQVPVNPYSNMKSLVLYFLQPLGMFVKIMILQTLSFGFFEFKYYYLNADFLDSIFWPNPILIILLQIANCFFLNHYFRFFRKLFVFFRPFYIYIFVIKKVYNFSCYVGNASLTLFKKATKPLYDALVDLLKFLRKVTSLFRFVATFLKFIFRRLIDFINTVRAMIRLSKNGYYQVLTKAFFFFNKFNLIGDLFFTIFVILWMFWPFAIAFYFRLTSLWISAFAISAVLMVKGYLLIKKISSK